MPRLITLILFLALSHPHCSAQYNSQLTDGRNTDTFCENYRFQLETKPKEILFGVQVNDDGNVYFTMNGESWFKTLFTPGTGITVDLVSTDRYSCNQELPKNDLFRGFVLPPLMFENFASHRLDMGPGIIALKIGKVPPDLKGKALEGNLVIVSGRKVAYYETFADIPRAGWGILPTGLYLDTLVQFSGRDTTLNPQFTYQRTAEITIPFEKGKDTYHGNGIQRIIDSLHLDKYIIQKVDIRAYSSIEGPETVNKQLMKGRANAMISLLKTVQPDLKRINILAAENWLEFYRDLQPTPFRSLGDLTRPEIKVKLLQHSTADSLESILSRERKAILTLYYEPRQPLYNMPKDSLLPAFSHAVADKKIARARYIQRRIFELIADNKLPDTYAYRLEVPRSKDYWELMNDRIILQYQVNLTGTMVAMRAFQELHALDPGNGRVNYNLCAFTLLDWQSSDSVDKEGLRIAIDKLAEQGIDPSLVKRLQVNYYILLSNDLQLKEQFEAKDSAVQFIRQAYEHVPLTDEDRFSLAKFFSFYSQEKWAEELIVDRVDQLDVTEDLVFYYVNLGFFKYAEDRGDKYAKALINAFTLNRERFCRLFHSMNKGGASMQLLEDEIFRRVYCEKCRQ